MDILVHLPDHDVVVCRPCGVAVAPHNLQAHLNKIHVEQSTALASRDLVRIFVNETLPSMLEKPLLDPRTEELRLPQPDCKALPGLRLYQGFGCNSCGFVCKSINRIRQHHNVEHAHVRRHRGGKRVRNRSAAVYEAADSLSKEPMPWHMAHYQRFFSAGKGSHCFRVLLASAESPRGIEVTRPAGGPASNETQSITDKVIQQLRNIEGQSVRIKDVTARSEVSPWLERTRWTSYLEGSNLAEVSELAGPVGTQSDPLLQVFARSVDRLVESAYATVCSDKINYFGQRCISSFLPAKRMYNRPLLVKLQATTYKRYKDSWKRLIAFVYRTNVTKATAKPLRHRLTSCQTALFDKLICQSRAVLHSGPETTALKEMEFELDDICLDFCISLLDHDLKGDLFESAVLGYLAVMGIDNHSSRFHEAHSYTPLLSGFIKISQMLVLESAFRTCETKRSADPLDLLEEMRQRFMTIDCRTPFSWTIQLRSFGKKIRDSTTSIGYIQWSEDEKTLFYKDLELRISDFQAFVRAQVVIAQRLLEEIIMLHPEETRENVVPLLHLHNIRDNPTVIDNGWNFLQDNRNKASLPDGSTWMLRRVLDNEWLRDEFVSTDTQSRVEWKPKALQGYRRQVNRFLEHLLLLVHLTSGQPARGTEIISLRHVNTVHHRNLFVEDGLVAIVTSYHKGYTCTGSTKIIHRYLPKEVGELLVYYLWLILPFAKQVAQLAPTMTKQIPDSFLWSQGGDSWNSQKLSEILKRETKLVLGTPLTISIYRHVAIAISRRCLQGGGFRRDYDVVEKRSDHQTTHNSWTAGRLYARGLEEAPGHVEARRSEFRMVSRRWHAFLGFRQYLRSRKRSLEDSADDTGRKLHKTSVI